MGSALNSAIGSFSPVRFAERLRLLEARRATGVEHGAAVLLADITGFTLLTERIAETYSDAPERLTRVLNEYFGLLIDRIEGTGGMIVTFVGDALIASWPAEGDVRDVALRSLACALGIRADVSAFRTPYETKLETKIALGVGRATTARVGGFGGKWRIVTAGDPVLQATDAISLCAPGAIVVSPQVWAHVREVARGETIEDGCVCVDEADAIAFSESPIVDALEIEPELVRGFVPDAVLHRLDAGQEGWLADLRHVTAMFVGLRPLDWRRPDAWLLLQTAISPVQRHLSDHEGSLDKIVVDEKGTTLIAAFGLPPTKTDRPAQRAIAAATAIAADVRAQGLSCDIGIASGRLLCGPIGNARRREYTLVGSTVNLAARLMQHADGGVVCDEATYARAGHVAGARSAATLALKGFAELVTAYTIEERPRTTAPAPSSAMTTVGREREISAIAELYDRIGAGMGGVIVLEGEAGIGKSRVAAVAKELAVARGIRSLHAEGRAIETLSAWHSWRTVFGDLFAIDAEASPSERAGRLVGELGRFGASLDLMPLLNPVFGLEMPDTDVTSRMVGDARAVAARGLLVGVLKRAAGSAPLAIVVDDAHWLDSTSWKLLAEAVRANAPIAIVVLTRPIENAPDPALEVFRAAGDDHFKIPYLTLSQVRAFLAQHLDAGGLEEPLVKWLYERGEGNPYLTQELAFALREAGVFDVAHGRTDADLASRLAGFSLPQSVEQVVNLRIDRLAPSEALLLKTASVIGPTFSFDMLEVVHPISNDVARLGELADALVAAHMIEPRSGAPGTYSFRHRITQEGAYASLPGEQRQSLHERVARELERRHAGELGGHLSILAHHWTAAGVDDRALYYLETAGERALASGSYLEAYGLFSQAVQRANDTEFDAALAGSDRRAAWHRHLAEAHYGLGNAGDNIAECKRSLALLGISVPSRRLATTLALFRHGAVATVRSMLPRRLYEARTETERVRARIAAMAAHRMANAAWTEDDIHLSFLGTVVAYANAIRTDAFVNSARCTAAMGLVLGVSRVVKPAEALFVRSIREAESIEDLEGLAYAHYTRALYLATVGGHWAKVHVDVERALELVDELGNVQERQISLVVAGMSCLLAGDFNRAGDYYARLLESALLRRHSEHVVWAYEGGTYALLRQGRREEAMDSAQRWRAVLPRLQVGGVSLLNAALGAVFVPALAGHPGEALAHLDAAKEAVQALRVPFWAATITLDLFGDALDVLLSEPPGQIDVESLRVVERVFVKGVGAHARRVPNAAAVALLHRARAESRAGRDKRAIRLARAALDRAVALDAPFDAARARLLLATLGDTGPDGARAHLDAAAESFERCGAEPYLAQCRGLSIRFRTG